MRKFKFKINGNNYDVHIKQFEHDVVTLEVNGTEYAVEVETISKPSKTPTLVRPAVPKPQRKEQKIKREIAKAYSVKAPLPGTILKIFVKEGDQVKKGDKLMIMEAMKMENDVLAERDGVISNLHVAAGDNVLQNDVLIEFS